MLSVFTGIHGDGGFFLHRINRDVSLLVFGGLLMIITVGGRPSVKNRGLWRRNDLCHFYQFRSNTLSVPTVEPYERQRVHYKVC